MDSSREDCFVVPGKLALPYQYFAGRTGSRFIIALRDRKKILGLRCDRCAKVFVPPRSICERCFSDLTDSWVELEDTGTVTGHTVVRYAEPHQPLTPPYVVALILIDGADTPLVHVVKGIPPGEVKAGLRVTARFAEKTTSTILEIDHFAPLER